MTRFDHEEARALRASGVSVVDLAKRYGVSRASIYYAINNRLREQRSLERWSRDKMQVDYYHPRTKQVVRWNDGVLIADPDSDDLRVWHVNIALKEADAYMLGLGFRAPYNRKADRRRKGVLA